LIPYNDPSVLLTTAGMQQFVPYFLGRERPPHTRFVSIQKCFRTTDIDEVGDRSHLTFFEMLGNFSIGDYFKKDVIPWALEFTTRHLGLDLERLWITVHETDDEAEQWWLEAGIPKERIKRFGDEHNWWGPSGKSGPCGPNSELYYEQGSGYGCGFPEDPPDCDCGRLEFWNLVFIQYNQDEQKQRTLLPKKHVDTGMGLERATVVALGLKSIYDTDLFQPISLAAGRIAGVTYSHDSDTDYALRVLADHGRGMTFLVLDGVVPGNAEREYVLRRLIRRAIRYGRRLGINGLFLGQIIDAVVERMQAYYPDLATNRERIKQIIAGEEEQFGRTLQSGQLQIDRLVGEAKAGGVTTIPGERVFDLYQTYGFPVELTEEMLREQRLSFDRAEYEAALAAEQERARAGARFQHAQDTLESAFGDLPPTEFLAWTDTQGEARVLALQPGKTSRLILQASPFYPVGGGQVGDTGWIRTPSGIFVVEDTRMDGGGHIVHYGHLDSGEIEVGELATAEVDGDRRERSMRHHTATHLLHRALKDRLGEATSQQGSYVGPDQLRFDFNAQPLKKQALDDVARIINERSMDDLPVEWQIMPLERARQTGAVAMFGERYGDDVRVVSIGDYSRELCGGTHTHHSGELGPVVIASEAGIASGIRRIVAYAGQPALDYLNARLRTLESIAERLGTRSAEDIEGRIDSLLAEQSRLQRELERRQREHARESAASLARQARDIRGVKVVASAIDHADKEELRRVVDEVRRGIGSGVVVVGSREDGRGVQFVAGVTPDLTQRVRAGDVVRAVAQKAGGGGGGGADFGTGSGKQPDQLEAALNHTYTVVDDALAS
jgi:alanyl-tRNA synthetase